MNIFIKMEPDTLGEDPMKQGHNKDTTAVDSSSFFFPTSFFPLPCFSCDKFVFEFGGTT